MGGGNPQKSEYKNYSKEELIKEIKILRQQLKHKKYGLVWDKEREKEQVVLECEENLPILNEIKNKEIKTKGNEYNLLIEGDNYHALTCLNYTHKEKIDLIYIDPPYNTGNNDFTYNDKYVDKEDGYRHSKWLNFIEKRLKLAKKLLKSTGIIFISIDDIEYAQLKLICDKIFGENNFITNIIWKSRSSLQYSEPVISGQTEYVLVYVKNRSLWNSKKKGLKTSKVLKETDELTYSNPDNDPNGKWTSSGLIRDDGRSKYDFKTPSGKIYDEAWLYAEENMKKFAKEKRLWYGKNEDSKPRKKSYWNEFNGRVSSNLLMDEFYYFKDIDDSFKKRKLFEIGTTEYGTNELKNIFNTKKSPLDYPKPSTLIKYLIKLYPLKNSIILDFFAGSGTTGHAVLQLNKEDDGNRKFILCTNNENKICEEVTYPRMEKVIKGYKKYGSGEKVEGLGGSVKYFRTNFVKKTNNRDQLKLNLTQECTEMLCVKDNVFNLQKEKENFKIFSSNKKDRFLCIYYNFVEDSFKDFLKEIKKLDGKKHIYVFSLDNKIDESLFLGIKEIIIESIPQKILDVYEQLVRLNIKGG